MNYQYWLLITIIRERDSRFEIRKLRKNLDKFWKLIFIGGFFRLDGYFYLEIVNGAFENAFLTFKIVVAMPAEFAMNISNFHFVSDCTFGG